MVDKPQTPGRARVGPVIGHLDDVTLLAVDRALAVFLELAELDPPSSLHAIIWSRLNHGGWVAQK